MTLSVFPTDIDSFSPDVDGSTQNMAEDVNQGRDFAIAAQRKIGVDGLPPGMGSMEEKLQWWIQRGFKPTPTVAFSDPLVVPPSGNIIPVTGAGTLNAITYTGPGLLILEFDATVTLVHSGTMILAGGVDAVLHANESIVLYNDATRWREVTRTITPTLPAVIADEGTARPVRPTLNFRGVGVSATDDAPNNRTNVDITSGTGGHIIQDEGTTRTGRSHLNFVGGGVAATDDAGNDATLVTVPGVTVADEANPLTQRDTLNFIGAGVTAVDNSGATRTDITIPGPAIQSSGIDVPNRGKLNIGGAVSIVDDGANDRTNITITGGGGGGGLVIEDESAPMTPRGILAFEGDGVSLVDDSGGGRTVVQVQGVSVYDEGGLAGGPVNILNFVGAGVVASVTGANATVTVAGGGGGGANGFAFTKPVIAGTGGPGGAWSTFNPGSPACITIADTGPGILLGNDLNGTSDPAGTNWRGMSVPISWPPASGWEQHFGLRLPYQGSTPAPGPLYAVGFSDGTHVWATVIEWNSTGGGPCWDVNIRKISALDGTGETNVGVAPFHLTAPQPTVFWRLRYDGTNGHGGFNAGEGEQYFCEDNFNTTTEGWTPNKLVVIMRAKNSSGPISTTLRHWGSVFPTWV